MSILQFCVYLECLDAIAALAPKHLVDRWWLTAISCESKTEVQQSGENIEVEPGDLETAWSLIRGGIFDILTLGLAYDKGSD